MLKRNLAAAALTLGLFAGNSQAAFVEYDLNGVTFSDGAVASGFFYQDTSNDAVVYYSIDIPKTSALSRATFRPSGIFDAVGSTSRSFGGNGPSSFSVFDNLSDFYYDVLSLTFSRSNPAGVFAVSGFQTQQPIPDLPPSANGFSARRDIVSGTTSLGIANADIVAGLEAGFRDFNVIAPAPFRGTVPEPGTYALVAIGVLGFLGARKRKRA